MTCAHNCLCACVECFSPTQLFSWCHIFARVVNRSLAAEDDEKRFTWSDGVALDQREHRNWAPKEPNNVDGKEDCVLMEDDGWKDIACETRSPCFVCEFDDNGDREARSEGAFVCNTDAILDYAQDILHLSSPVFLLKSAATGSDSAAEAYPSILPTADSTVNVLDESEAQTFSQNSYVSCCRGVHCLAGFRSLALRFSFLLSSQVFSLHV